MVLTAGRDVPGVGTVSMYALWQANLCVICRFGGIAELKYCSGSYVH